MYFQLVNLILWPRDGTKPRILQFHAGTVNVISGASKTGKSAVIPIIDYCLGAGRCAIPVGVIREKCSWFGVVVETIEGRKLLARREPGDQKNTSDMFVLEGPSIDVPDTIPEKNARVENVRASLDRLAGLSNLEFEPGTENGFKARPSFRDLMAFMFQPQNIVANPDVLFFKADTTEHREKLKTIFPYVLGAITPRILAARQELDGLQRELRRKDQELRSILSVTDRWATEGRAWLQQAIELGLTTLTSVPDTWEHLLSALREIADQRDRITTSPTLAGIDSVLDRLHVLRSEESKRAASLIDHRQRLNELRRLREGSDAYHGAILVQRDRLALADWLRELSTTRRDVLANLEPNAASNLDELCKVLDDLEVQSRSQPFMAGSLDKEWLRQHAATETAIEGLNTLRAEIRTYEETSAAASKEAARHRSIERFVGRLEQALKLFDQADSSSPLRAQIDDLQRKIERLSREISESEIRRRVESALTTVQGLTGAIVPQMDAEWKLAPVRVNITELTVQVTRDFRQDYLWEIGSGANWLAYHVAVTLALQQYFLGQPHHPVPALLIYDQPSQVYFPKKAGSRPTGQAHALDDQDRAAVRMVFKVLGESASALNGRLQIIVLDHADEDVWGKLPGVHLTEEWRGNAKLVPVDWLDDDDVDD